MNAFTTGNRVERHTSKSSLDRIRSKTISNLKDYSSNHSTLNARLKELNDEWDIERYLETNASIIAFVGVILGAFVSPYWLILPAIVLAFLFQHALQGWCPPLPIFRKMGKRTKHEIEIERNALKVLRGDFKSVSTASEVYEEAAKD